MRSVYIPGVFRPRGVAWLSLLTIAVGLGYVTTTAMRTTEPMSSHATMTQTGSTARIRLTEAQVVERLRPMLAQRGFESDVIDGPMLARAPGQLAEVDYTHADADALLRPLQVDAWLVVTTAGRWWLWEYGVAAPADLRAQRAELDALHRMGPERRGLD